MQKDAILLVVCTGLTCNMMLRIMKPFVTRGINQNPLQKITLTCN